MAISPPPQVSIGRPAVAARKVEFVKAGTEPARRMVISLDGAPKDGRTHFCLTAPGPISLHSFDLGYEGVVEPFAATKDIYPFNYTVPMTTRLPGSGLTTLADPAARVWEDFVYDFRAAVEQMRTVVVDSMSVAWELCRLARLGKLTQVLPVQYTAVNAEFRQLVQFALAAPNKPNVIFIHRLKAEYKDDKKTGNFERAGFGDIDADVQSVLRTSRDYSKEGIDQFSVTIQECRANFLASNKKFTGKDMTFSKVATAIYPNTKEEDWQ